MASTERAGTGSRFSRPHVRLPLEMGLLLLGAELVRRTELPWRVAGLVFAVLAVVQGVRALGALKRARAAGEDGTGPFATSVVAVGLALGGALVLLQVALLALHPLVAEHEACSDRALTRTAQDACDERLLERIQDLTGVAPPG